MEIYKLFSTFILMAERKFVLLLIKEEDIEVWGGLTKMCRFYAGFSYHYLKGKVSLNSTIEYKGYQIKKVYFN